MKYRHYPKLHLPRNLHLIHWKLYSLTRTSMREGPPCPFQFETKHWFQKSETFTCMQNFRLHVLANSHYNNSGPGYLCEVGLQILGQLSNRNSVNDSVNDIWKCLTKPQIWQVELNLVNILWSLISIKLSYLQDKDAGQFNGETISTNINWALQQWSK